jgi:hypothetical protein
MADTISADAVLSLEDGVRTEAPPVLKQTTPPAQRGLTGGARGKRAGGRRCSFPALASATIAALTASTGPTIDPARHRCHGGACF